jgi:UDP-N-acetylmuramate--alanine ligase
MDPDHLDIYGDENQFADAFLAFGNKVRANGVLLVNYGLTESFSFSNPGLKTYSLKDKRANSYVKNWVVNDGVFHFDVVVDGKELNGFKLPMGGSHNLENALAAITVATIVGIEEKRIKDAVANFKGVKRRFEYIFSNAETVMIDDYAHHPKELNALVRGVREMHPTRKITIVFQPHLFSRTRDFADGFASALNEADEVLLLPIYPARELPIEGVKSEMLAEKMDTGKVICCEKNELENLLKQKKEKGQLELLVMAGAGDIDALIEPIKYALN